MLRPELITPLKPHDASERLWRYPDVLLKEPIQIALGVANVDRELLYLNHPMRLDDHIEGAIKERIILVVLVQQMCQGGLKQRNLLLRVFRIAEHGL